MLAAGDYTMSRFAALYGMTCGGMVTVFVGADASVRPISTAPTP